MKLLRWIDVVIEKISSVLLIATVCGIFLFSLTGMLSRWLGFAPVWIDPLIRHLVFLTAFLSGILITGKSRHLSIDLVQKYLEHAPAKQRLLRRIVAAISAFASLWMMKAGIDFLLSEMQYGRDTFLGIHSAVWAAAIPVGFALMGYRFFYLFCASFQREKTC